MQIGEPTKRLTYAALKARRLNLLFIECPRCEVFHLQSPDERSDDGVYPTKYCDPCAGFPMGEGYRVEVRGPLAGASPKTGPVPLPEPRLWRHLSQAGSVIGAAVLGVLLQRARPVRSCRARLGGVRLHVNGERWTFGEATGAGWPDLAAALYRTDAPTASVRLTEAALGLRLDAPAVLDLHHAFSTFFDRQRAAHDVGMFA